MRDLAIIETILRNRYHFFNEIREGIGLPEKMRAMLVSSVAFLALYGAVMGSPTACGRPSAPLPSCPFSSWPPSSSAPLPCTSSTSSSAPNRA